MFIAKHCDKTIEVEFWADGERCDYGVSRSPVWWEPNPDTYKILNLAIDGEDVDIKDLSPEQQAEIWKLVDDVEFERE